ncbi:MAG: hypothetical protein A3F70_10985 [Acidobacteria bacterium RIFCSPLOWO2_12_FULL_67_14]|nr:MAG: hypothetical protein A3H29_10010 [Acidobacteria bacterium RIFCSPLOWO2_02_FULL_67_21]OFW39344.1 MAG: hypothetical protein A3F70_10985 [Acidobacteria bacterium RIFCSPLOWO2_12_FULL_67_14]
MELVSEPFAQFLLRKFALSGATFTKRVDEGEHLVENWIAQGSGGSGLVQRLKADAAVLTFRKRPYWWQLGARLDLFVEGRRGIRRGDPTRNLASPSRKRVLHSVYEELLHGSEQRAVTIRIARHELRQRQSLEGCMYF